MPGSIANIGFAAPAIALPQAARGLGVSTGAATWLVAGYTLGIAGSLPMGRLIDARGSRSVLGWAMALLAGGSAGVLIAPNLALLVVARAIQGLGASMIAVIGFTAIGIGAEGDRTAAFGALTSIGALVAGAGPIIGAGVEAVAGWRAVMALPLLAVLGTGGLWRAPIHPAPGADTTDDAPSTILVLIAAAALLAIVEAPATKLALGFVVAVLALGVVAMAMAVMRARAISTRLLPLHVLRNPRLVWMAIGAGAIFATYLGASFLFPELLHRSRPVQTGVILLPSAAIGALAAYLVGVSRPDPSLLLAVLGGSSCAGLVAIGVPPGGSAVVALGACLIVPAWAAAQVIGLECVPAAVATTDVGAALALFNFFFVSAGGLGAAIAGTLQSATSTSATAILLCPIALVAVSSAHRLRSLRYTRPSRS
jgi:DHA2 family metal-tetracycline-proton antiporter-like MFS transporter